MVMVSGGGAEGMQVAGTWGMYCKSRDSPAAGRYRACVPGEEAAGLGVRGAHSMVPLGTSSPFHPAHSPAVNPALAAGSGSQALR